MVWILKFTRINAHYAAFVCVFALWEPYILKTSSYDVAVIGAGPCGCICARDLALKGYKVLLAEKRPVIGIPVRCGEATGARKRLGDFLPVKEHYIETDIHGLIINSDDIHTRFRMPDSGLMLDRVLFDQELANLAKGAGATLVLNARVTNILPVSNNNRCLRIQHPSGEQEVQAAMVVGADGAEALCGRWVGLNCRQLPQEVCSAINLRIEGPCPDPEYLSFWLNYSGIPKGYVWVFPKVKSGTINLGAGTLTPKSKEPNMKEVILQFKEEYFPNHKIISENGGAVPVSGFIKDYSDERFILAGDAAHHTNPLTGGGIASGMYAGQLAARWIDNAFKKNTFTSTFFKNYEADCWKGFGKYHRTQWRIKQFLFGLKPQQQYRLLLSIKNTFDEQSSLIHKIKGASGMGMILLQNLTLVLDILKKKHWSN